MGLDNGVYLHITNKEKFGDLPKWLHRKDWEIELDTPDDISIKLLYWRNCFNVRNIILETVDFNVVTKYGKDLNGEDYHYDILVYKSLDEYEETLDTLMNDIYRYEKWDTSDSNWDWIDIQPKILEDGSESEWMKVNNGISDYTWNEMAIANRWLEFLRTKDSDSYYLQFEDC